MISQMITEHDHYYRMMLAIAMAAVVACVFTIFAATAQNVDQDVPPAFVQNSTLYSPEF